MVGLTAFFYLHYSKEKLKAAMGHSNIMVSLTYLRGLDVAELKESDMPMIWMRDITCLFQLYLNT